MPAPLIIFGVAAAGVGAFEWWKHRKGAAPSSSSPSSSTLGIVAVPRLLPAYAKIVSATPADRQAILDAATAIGINVRALADVIESESGWDTTVPKSKTGTPRGGLNQLTQGAHLPGYDTAEKVWAVRDLSMIDQLKKIVVPYFLQIKAGGAAWSYDGTALELYKWNFLPADAKKAMDFRLGEKDSPTLVTKNGTLTRGQVYSANPGFDPQKKGYFTWQDVENRVLGVRKDAGGKVVNVEGLVSAETPSSFTAPSSSTSSSSSSSSTPDGGPGTPAPAILALRDAVNKQWPSRGKASDGIMGDAAHQARQSDHNDGNAIDFTHDPVSGPNLANLAEVLLKDPRIAYVIWNDRIQSRTIQPGTWRPYCNGKDSCNPHTRHMHVSIEPKARGDVHGWDVGFGVSSTPAPVAVEVAPPGGIPGPATFPDATAIGHYLLDSWRGGLVDNVTWIPLKIGPFQLLVAAEALSVQGMRIPVDVVDAYQILLTMGAILPTREIVDAMWAAADRKLVVEPMDTTSMQTWGKARAWNKRMGGIGTTLSEGGAKHWILGQPAPNGAINYGLRKPDGSVWQSPGRVHNDTYYDETQLLQPIMRGAIIGGVTIDLLDYFSTTHAPGEFDGSNGKELGGPAAPVQITALRGI